MLRSLLVALTALFTWTASALAVELVMIDSPGCPYCHAWKEDIAHIYPKTAEGQFAPLYIMDITDVKRSTLKLQRRVVYTPTFLLIENERELTRLEGYPGEDFFWFHLRRMLTEHTAFKSAKAQ